MTGEFGCFHVRELKDPDQTKGISPFFYLPFILVAIAKTCAFVPHIMSYSFDLSHDDPKGAEGGVCDRP